MGTQETLVVTLDGHGKSRVVVDTAQHGWRVTALEMAVTRRLGSARANRGYTVECGRGTDRDGGAFVVSDGERIHTSWRIAESSRRTSVIDALPDVCPNCQTSNWSFVETVETTRHVRVVNGTVHCYDENVDIESGTGGKFVCRHCQSEFQPSAEFAETIVWE